MQLNIIRYLNKIIMYCSKLKDKVFLQTNLEESLSTQYMAIYNIIRMYYSNESHDSLKKVMWLNQFEGKLFPKLKCQQIFNKKIKFFKSNNICINNYQSKHEVKRVPYQVGIRKFSDSFINSFCSGFDLIKEKQTQKHVKKMGENKKILSISKYNLTCWR